MKIATRIAAGYGVVIILILTVLTYQMVLIHRMQSINQELSGINFRASILALELSRQTDQVEEFAQKYAVTADPGYLSQGEEMRNAFARNLDGLLSLPLSSTEKEATERLAETWREFSIAAMDSAVETGAAALGEESGFSKQIQLLEAIRNQTQAVIQTTRLEIESKVAQSATASQHAQRIAWMAALATLLVSLGVSYIVVRSISGPLGDLTEGTRAVTEGKYFYQLDSSGKDELATLAASFNEMTRRLGELEQLKKDFISHVSHELKSPLAAIRETLRLLIEEIPGPLSDQQKRLVTLSLQSSSRLSSMIGNLLDLSRIEAGAMEYDLRKQDLRVLVKTSVEEHEVLANERNMRLLPILPENPLQVTCDGDRMLQVVGNLISNAIKYSLPGGSIEVVLRGLSDIPESMPLHWKKSFGTLRPATAHGESYALIMVADQGPGITDREKERVFEKFHRVKTSNISDSRNRSAPESKVQTKTKQTGVGLGLAISRNIIEAHRGAIWVEDNPSGGSKFCILLATGNITKEEPLRMSLPL